MANYSQFTVKTEVLGIKLGGFHIQVYTVYERKQILAYKQDLSVLACLGVFAVELKRTERTRQCRSWNCVSKPCAY